jgi:hypothetical protein
MCWLFHHLTVRCNPQPLFLHDEPSLHCLLASI